MNALITTRSAGCSNSSPLASTKMIPVARLPVLSMVTRSTSQLVFAVKLGLRIRTGSTVVIALALE